MILFNYDGKYRAEYGAEMSLGEWKNNLEGLY